MLAIRAIDLGCSVRPRESYKNLTAAQAWQAFRAIMSQRVSVDTEEGIHRAMEIGGRMLKNVSLSIEKGSIVCLDGPSGSGKNILLKIMAGRLPPTEGRLELYGTVASLLNAGENLHEDLTAIENVELHCDLTRAPKGKAAEIIDDVIEFAGLRRFSNVAVSRYSTGMQMRLSLAIVLQSNPDILLLDDVLSVGDVEFQQRCVDRLLAMNALGCTMVLSLGDEIVRNQLATRIITFEGGEVISDAPPKQFFVGQHGFGAANASWSVAPHHPENDAAALRSIRLDHVAGHDGSDLNVTMNYDIKLARQRCRPSVNLFQGRVRLFRSLYPAFIDVSTPRPLQVVLRLPIHLFGEGTYVVEPQLRSEYEQAVYILKHRNAMTIALKRKFAPPQGTMSLPLVTPDFTWEVERMTEQT